MASNENMVFWKRGIFHRINFPFLVNLKIHIEITLPSLAMVKKLGKVRFTISY
jgi:hypothetical protein